METEELPELADAPPTDRAAYASMLRYYELAKRAEWQVRDLPWNDAPPIPGYKGTPHKDTPPNEWRECGIPPPPQGARVGVREGAAVFRDGRLAALELL